MILLLTNKWDISTDFVIAELRNRGAAFFRLNAEDLPSIKLSASFPPAQLILETDSGQLNLFEDSLVIYLRRPGRPFAWDSASTDADPEVAFCQNQWKSLMDGLLFNRSAQWVNHPAADSKADCKLGQLKAANELGFVVPRTLVTADLKQVNKFRSSEKVVVAKAVGNALVEDADDDYFVFTNIIAEADDIQSDQLSLAPVMFQQFLDRKTDLRVTVVGDNVFSAKITANGAPITGDWRTLKSEIEFEKVQTLPSDVRQRCIKLARFFNLSFAAIDLALQDGEYYFFEINPCGEWGWLQQRGLPIAAAIAEELLEMDVCRNVR